MSVVNLVKESLPEFNAGGGTVGTTPQALANAYPVRKSVTVRANVANSSTIQVGPKLGSAASGFILAAGETSPPIYVDDLAKVFVVGGAASQAYSWICS